MRGVPEGRGEPAYLLCKYAEMSTFRRKVDTPSDLALLGHLPHKWGRQAVLRYQPEHHQADGIDGQVCTGVGEPGGEDAAPAVQGVED